MEKGLPDDELPPPERRGSEKDTSSQPPPPPRKMGPARGTPGSQLPWELEKGVDLRARPAGPQPGEGRSLADKGVKEKVREATPEGEGHLQTAAGGAGPSALSGERLGF